MDNSSFFGGLEQTVRAKLDTDSNLRKRAIRQIADPQELVSLLLQELQDSNAPMRREAIEALLEMRYNVATPPDMLLALRNALQDSDLIVRQKAARIIADMGANASRSPGMAEGLISATNDADAAVRIWSVVALCPIARDPAVRQVLCALSEADPSAAVRAEAEGVLNDTRTLEERIMTKLSAILNQIVPLERIRESLTASLPATPKFAPQFGQPGVKSTEDHRGSLEAVTFYVYKAPGTKDKELVVETMDEELLDQVILLYFRDDRLNQIIGAEMTDREALPCTYLLLQSESGGAIGKTQHRSEWGDPLFYEVIRPEDIDEDKQPLLIASCEEQKQNDPDSAVGWQKWLTQITPST